MKTISIEVLEGDIAQVASDALITAANSQGAWFGGIDRVIQRAAGRLFHEQAHATLPLTDGQTVVTRGDGHDYNAKFKNVVFVIDDLHLPVSDIVFAGLKAASDAGFTSVTLPAMRMGVMAGAVERTPQDTVRKISEGINRFYEQNAGTPITSLTFVVFQDPATAELMRQQFLPAVVS